MKRSLTSLGPALAVLIAFAATASAQERGAIARPERAGAAGERLQHIVKCLSILDLTAAQKTAIEGILAAAKPSLDADLQTLRADREKLRTDIANGADKCVVGQDALTAHADGAKLRADAQAVRDQILGQLTADQQSKLKGCLQAPRGALEALGQN